MGNHGAGKRRQLLKQGKALPNPDGPPRFPIEDASDLGSAINLARTPEERQARHEACAGAGQVGPDPRALESGRNPPGRLAPSTSRVSAG